MSHSLTANGEFYCLQTVWKTSKIFLLYISAGICSDPIVKGGMHFPVLYKNVKQCAFAYVYIFFLFQKNFLLFKFKNSLVNL